MKIVATSDLHGYLPTIPSCDVLVIAGDILPLDSERGAAALYWLERVFRLWLESVPAKHVFGIAGNHDFAFETHLADIRKLDLPWRYLQDEGCEIDGVSFWGIPWIPHLASWAFYGDPKALAERYGWIPQGIDVVISHGPPMGHLDNKEYMYGARQANDMLKRVKPKIFICGHIHESYGVERGYRKTTDLYNVSHCDLLYYPVNRPRVITLDAHLEEGSAV